MQADCLLAATYGLESFVNGGRYQANRQEMWQDPGRMKSARRLAHELNCCAKFEIAEPTKSATVMVPVYQGSNPFVLKMKNRLQTLDQHVVGAMIHGSLAEENEIPYSDFDALVILKNETILDAHSLRNIAGQLRALTSIMREFDPLQHHGWFAIPEFLLANYPEDYLPVSAMGIVRSLGAAFELKLQTFGLKNALQSFDRIARVYVSNIDVVGAEALHRTLHRLHVLLH